MNFIFRHSACAGALLALCLLTACSTSEPPAAEPEAAAAEESVGGPVVLEAPAIEKMGIATTAAQAATFSSEAAGFGVVLTHDVIAQALADVATAEAAASQSRHAMERLKTLNDTPGAMSSEIRETSERQVIADDVALTLARRKFSATFGQTPPWQDISSSVVRDIATGKSKLVRATFSFSDVAGANPQSLRLARIDVGGKSENWTTDTVWDAPADATLPGRSLFTLLENSNASEGERLNAWAAVGAPESGVLVPQAAVVLSDGAYWCYVEKPAGTFTRTAIDADKPLASGYFVKEGIASGDLIVTTAAGLLLARELNSSTEAE